MTETPEINARGNAIVRSFHFGRERYHYDAKLLAEGFKQYDTDQDAWYFGVWVHLERREIVSFAEGDEDVVTCPTQESFVAELRHMQEFYGDPPPAIRVITDKGDLVHLYDTRPGADLLS